MLLITWTATCFELWSIWELKGDRLILDGKGKYIDYNFYSITKPNNGRAIHKILLETKQMGEPQLKAICISVDGVGKP